MSKLLHDINNMTLSLKVKNPPSYFSICIDFLLPVDLCRPTCIAFIHAGTSAASLQFLTVLKCPGSPAVGKSWMFGIPLGKCIANEAELSSNDNAEPSGKLIEALSLSYGSVVSPRGSSGEMDRIQVPYIVRICCTHLQTHGTGEKSFLLVSSNINIL